MRPAAMSVTEGPRSAGALIAEYYLSTPFKDLQPITQRTYRGVLEQFRTKYGRDLVMNFSFKHLNAIFHVMSDTPAQAASLRKRLFSVFELGVDLDWIATNPVPQSKQIKYRVKGFTPWSEDDIAAYKAHWPPGSRERLALELLLCTGVRRSNAVELGHQHCDGTHISVASQAKSKTRIALPLHPDLAREIARAPKTLVFMMTLHGSAFTAKGFSNWLTERAEKAGVPERSPHGLRKAIGRRMAEAGCTQEQIAAMLGHASVATAQVYTKSANQKVLADGAMKQLRKAKPGTQVSTPIVKPVSNG
jgi:site-specific recombinase XerD